MYVFNKGVTKRCLQSTYAIKCLQSDTMFSFARFIYVFKLRLRVILILYSNKHCHIHHKISTLLNTESHLRLKSHFLANSCPCLTLRISYVCALNKYQEGINKLLCIKGFFSGISLNNQSKCVEFIGFSCL